MKVNIKILHEFNLYTIMKSKKASGSIKSCRSEKFFCVRCGVKDFISWIVNRSIIINVFLLFTLSCIQNLNYYKTTNHFSQTINHYSYKFLLGSFRNCVLNLRFSIIQHYLFLIIHFKSIIKGKYVFIHLIRAWES